MTSCLSDMRTVRPQGRTFRITQPHGLRVSYLGTLPGLCNRSNRIVGVYRADYTLPYETTISKRARRKQWIGLLSPKNIRSFCCIYSSSAPLRSSVHGNRAPVMVHSESRSNDFGSPAVRADFVCLIDREITLRAKSSLIPHMYRNGSKLAQLRPVTQQRC
jgi:hypothetical protein